MALSLRAKSAQGSPHRKVVPPSWSILSKEKWRKCMESDTLQSCVGIVLDVGVAQAVSDPMQEQSPSPL